MCAFGSHVLKLLPASVPENAAMPHHRGPELFLLRFIRCPFVGLKRAAGCRYCPALTFSTDKRTYGMSFYVRPIVTPLRCSCSICVTRQRQFESLSVQRHNHQNSGSDPDNFMKPMITLAAAPSHLKKTTKKTRHIIETDSFTQRIH